ncbi:hypothetical protein BWQ96_02775 [Gracilariopsis chorda]|uniref:Uncharacterized protein n=1 Tax=Gracilariopsis chorda TaxID=448386 RepID=A0A2V3IZ72_9FLOR|nr:hypothetical protein BWQ96_02775 [Gracilariopsis chorda]|eukprot:PXF47444.1 hypothetical protein BWQ96_02775 [Gracilariopsis chorda]
MHPVADMAAINELQPEQLPDVEDDPYQVYTLRRPHERASSVVPQLPKQPEMAETRLRYRRIPAAARSGSFGSLGNHFPARFQFPTRRSLLDSLTSDDESVSFSVNQKPRPKIVRKRHRRRARATKGRFPSPNSVIQDFVISDDDDSNDDDDFDDDENDPKDHDGRVSLSRRPTPLLQLPRSPKPKPPKPLLPKRKSSGKPPIPTKTAAKPPIMPSLSRRPSTSTASRSADAVDETTRPCHTTPTRPSKSADAAVINRQLGYHHHPIHERPRNLVATILDPARTNDAHVPVEAPQAMSEEQRQRFVLVPEEPVLVSKKSRDKGNAKRKKNNRKKSDKAGRRDKSEGKDKHMNNRQAHCNAEQRDEREELGPTRDKELSVSFAHPRYTAEQAVKPLNAMQRLLHMLAFVRLGGVRRTYHK